MTTADGRVVGTTPLWVAGPPSRCLNLVLIAEGYREGELDKFATDASRFVETLVFNTHPLSQLQDAFNIYRIDVISTDSGADDPRTTSCPDGTGVSVRTYFDATFCNGGVRRALVVNNNTAVNVANGQLPQWHQILVIVNSPIHGGTGGQISVTSTASGWEKTAIHELGHSLYGLADEYEYRLGCGVDPAGTQDVYQGAEPDQWNITKNTNRDTIYWRHLIQPSTRMPTTKNADCRRCDPQGSPVPTGTVGAFEGAGYFHCGLFRPEFNCMMRNFASFCAVCQWRIRYVMQPFLPKFNGAWSGTGKVTSGGPPAIGRFRLEFTQSGSQASMRDFHTWPETAELPSTPNSTGVGEVVDLPGTVETRITTYERTAWPPPDDRIERSWLLRLHDHHTLVFHLRSKYPPQFPVPQDTIEGTLKGP